MNSTKDRNKLNRDLERWQNRCPVPFLTSAAGGIIGSLSAVNQWPPCLGLGSRIALIFFGSMMVLTLVFFIIRRLIIKRTTRKLMRLP